MQNRDTINSDTKRKLDFLKLLRGGEKKKNIYSNQTTVLK